MEATKLITIPTLQSRSGSYAWCGGNATGTRSNCNRVSSVAAIFEWAIAFLFGIYLATFVLDLWPAAKTSPRLARRRERQAREKGFGGPQGLEDGYDHYGSHADGRDFSAESNTSATPMRQV